MIPENFMNMPAKRLQRIICHELFHILSRANSDLREMLYAAIGFEKCDEVEFPAALKSRKITNPDAPRNDHCVRIKVGEEEVWAVPILFSNIEKYDTKRGGEFINYLQFQFLLVERVADGTAVKSIDEGGQPKLVDMRQVSGFFDQVGKNTSYVFHPEEILAENFALLVLREPDLVSPEIVEEMDGILGGAENKPSVE